MNKEIQIKIIGTAGSGKSTLAYAIQEFLNSSKISCDVFEQVDDGDEDIVKNTLTERLGSLSNDLSVSIYTYQANRAHDINE